MTATLASRSSYSGSLSSSFSSRGAMGVGSGFSMGGSGGGMSSGFSMGGGGGGMSSGFSMGGGSGMGMAMRSGSVHGGAGGRGIRISSAGSSGRLSAMGGGFGTGGGGGGGFSAFSMNAGAGGDAAFGSVSEKMAMQNLNHRLAQYLDKVRNLEEANAQLEEKIKNWVVNRVTVETRDYTTHLTTIDEVRTQIRAAGIVLAELALQVDNAKLAADDFRIKFESELSMRQSVEADIGGLKRMLGELALVKTDLEMELENLKEELAFLKKNHEEEKISMRTQLTGQIHVEVDAAPAADLNGVISEIREQYEVMVAKNRREAEAWFKTKAEAVEQEVRTSTEVLQTSSVEVKTAQTTVRDMELEMQSLLLMKASLEANLADVEGRYGAVMMGLQSAVTSLESQLFQIRADTERSAQDYQTLLDIKTRLEMEIAEYRRLLEGGDIGFSVKSGFTSAGLVETSNIKTSASANVAASSSVSSSSVVSTEVTEVVKVVPTEVVTVVTEVKEVVGGGGAGLVSSLTTTTGEVVSSTVKTTTEEVVGGGTVVSSTTTTTTEEVVVGGSL